jgi:hypothetical protein
VTSTDLLAAAMPQVTIAGSAQKTLNTADLNAMAVKSQDPWQRS